MSPQLSTDLLDSPATADLDALVSAERRRAILKLAARFALPARAAGYECRLASSDAADVDYNLAFFATSRLDELLREIVEAEADPLWRRIYDLLAPWARGQSPLTPFVPFVCAAFDCALSAPRLSVPNLSLCVDPEFFVRKLGKALPPLPFSQLATIARACARTLHGGEPAPEQLERLRSFASFAGTAEARHLSLMLARSGAPLKLDFRLSKSELGAFLLALGWGERAEAIQRDVSALLRLQTHVQLNVPLDLTPETALELEFLNDRADASGADRMRILYELVERGLATPDKARALAQVWQQPLVSCRDGQAIARSWYLKLRFLADGRAEAKAYIGLLPHGFVRHIAEPTPGGVLPRSSPL